MGLFRTQKRKPSYALFSRYAHYLPSVGGTFMLLVMFMLGAVLGNIVVLCMQAASAEFAEKFGMVVSYPVMFIPPMLYASAKSRRNEIFNEGYALDSNNFGKYGGLAMALIVSASTVAMAFVIEPVVSLLPDMPEWMEQIMEQMLAGGPLWVTLISVSVFAPFFEEWLCRGMVMRGLLKHTSPATAILLSSLFFAVLHMNPWQAIPAFCLGVLFGYVYYKTGSLKLTMLMHCVNNTMSVIFSQIPQFKEADTFMDVMSPWAYASTGVACALILASSVIIIRSIPKKDETLGGCDKVEALSIGE